MGKTQPEAMKLRETVAEVIHQWPGTEAICEAPSEGDDFRDPYFTLSLDVYYRSEIPDASARTQLFEGAGAFETRNGALKDRFFLDSVPVRIEYKRTHRIDQILLFSTDVVWDHRRAGTYGLYRLAYGDVVYSASGWVETVRTVLQTVPDDFWDALKTNWVPTMEHALVDMKASTARDDEFFFLQSLAVFLKTFASLLFVINRQFEPSARLLPGRLKSLPSLPERFALYFDSLLSRDEDMTNRRKCEIAEILTKSVVHSPILTSG